MFLNRSLACSLMFSLGLAAGASLTPRPTAAQTPDSARAARDSTRTAPDSAPARVERKPPLSPSGAFLRSFIVPGWAQLQLHRPVSALVFLGIEGTMVGLSLKANHDVKVARLTDQTPDSSVVQAKKKKREDWLVLLGFNHLMAGLEAYVGSHLYDFPGDLRIRATPSGIGASASVPFRVR
ncbi:MAG: hypothetical protein H0U85_09725 [Gemmatimonadales bacterium]|nr:hypothetical protein [Gemmatimonadales bacterium]